MNRKLLSFQTSTINDTNDITFNRPSEICELQNLNSNEHIDDMNDIPTEQKMEMPEQPENIKVSRETSDKKLSAGKDKSNNTKKLNNKLRFRYYSVGLLNSLHLLTANSNCNIDTTNKMYTPIKHLKQPRTRRYTINLPEENDELQSLTFNDAASYMDIGGDNSILNEIEEPLSLDTKTPYSHQRQSVINNNINNKSGFRERGWSLYNLKEQFISFFQPSDNKLALKLFGNKVALACEKRRQREQGKWIIHPCSNFRFYWNVIMLILLMANLIMLPVIISFFNDDLPGNWLIFNSISDTLFILDIIVNFRTGIIRNDFVDDIILDPTEIAREYLKTWFILDMISSIPMDYVLFAFKGYEQGERAEHLVQAAFM
ncbi:anaphase-promoting complex subunit Hcn1, variant 2 [Schistosoma haematobium]|uniref:Anaphase-promoting complex subunit Hcn1, variant 2 n=1 Tax=Schistosoma haematobium TaxID=6185 RepID=A0A922LEA7_SCHHA|nr:anaphase-promoting complex subunit Hcn1, variant 2 [Schistosoma haematobium]KAH9579394.1 anaphase-promoting complex subunit Hcn1, variant 2 [Schistosoma haematobium]